MRYLGLGRSGYGFGDVLDDPILPEIRGYDFVKFAVIAGVLIYLWRGFGKGK